jgi:hypothetical protein
MCGASTASSNSITASRNNARLLGRLSTTYILRSLRELASLHDGDILLAVVTMEIVAANTAHLNAGPEPRYTALDDVPPDEERRPVSALAIAGALGMPRETTRRHVKKLEAAGICKRVDGGFIVPASVLGGEAYGKAISANVVNLRMLVERLRDVGVV